MWRIVIFLIFIIGCKCNNIKYPKVISCVNEEIVINIKVGIVNIDQLISFSSRFYVYNNITMFPGPTILMKAGTVCNITLVNDLNGDSNCKYHANTMHCPDTTNLHTHGLHVSPKGHSDNMKIAITSQNKHKYTYNIMKEHLYGTYWYHAHFHGSTSLQLLGGLSGALLMETDVNLPSDLQQIYSKNNSHILVLNHIAFGQSGNSSLPYGLMQYEKLSNSFNNQTLNPNPTSHNVDVIVVNGIFNPTININVNDTNVLRIVYTGTIRILELELVNQNACHMKLLARDGIFQQTPYLDIKSIVLFQGSRADVAIQCYSIGNFTMRAYPNKQYNHILSTLNRHQQTSVLQLQVTNKNQLKKYLFPTSQVNFPKYLTSLENQDIMYGKMNVTNIQMAPIGLGSGVQAINGKSFVGFEHEERYLDILNINQVYEFNLIPSPPPPFPMASDTSVHPLHIHVNAFQIISENNNYTDVFRPYEFRDVIPILANDIIKIRLATMDFGGDYMLHCHLGEHADQGMVSLLYVCDDFDKSPECQILINRQNEQMRNINSIILILAIAVYIIFLYFVFRVTILRKCYYFHKKIKHVRLNDSDF